jgi:hypothetical protein
MYFNNHIYLHSIIISTVNLHLKFSEILFDLNQSWKSQNKLMDNQKKNGGRQINSKHFWNIRTIFATHPKYQLGY